jgi:proton-coupled amino acid transporter
MTSKDDQGGVSMSTGNNVPQHHERSPLLVYQATDDNIAATVEQDTLGATRHGSASVPETIVNMTKTCMGTGCLALPFAAQQGGLLLYIFGALGIALWNAFAAKRLLDCLELLLAKTQARTEDEQGEKRSLGRRSPPPPGTATLGKVAWYAMGPTGLKSLDVMTVILLLGIIVAYQDAIRSFLQDTPCTTHSDIVDAILIALMMAPLSIVPDVGYLSRISATGLGVLGFSFLVIAGYGIAQYDGTLPSSLHWFPQDGLTGASHWFGCTVFGFGVVPLTFNFRESMAEPSRMVGATTLALLGVALAYIIAGVGLLTLYPNIEGDVLHELPQVGILPIITRLAMVVVVLVTAPLLIVPCAELLEGKISVEPDQRTRVMVRFGICFATVAISVGVPGFVYVLSFVGCFCVALVGFVVPPLFHLVLLRGRKASLAIYWVDVIMLTWGIVATGISTAYTFHHEAAPLSSSGR